MHTLAVTLIVISEILKCKEMSDLEEKKKPMTSRWKSPRGKLERAIKEEHAKAQRLPCRYHSSE